VEQAITTRTTGDHDAVQQVITMAWNAEQFSVGATAHEYGVGLTAGSPRR
jgi:hypothetical protein